MTDTNHSTLLVVAGVSGSGKSTFGLQLARRLNVPFLDGDDLHPQSNIEKMKSGVPLEDSDREPWLYRIRTNALEMLLPPSITSEQPIRSGKQPHTMVVACSALKRKYRDMLRGSLDLENETTKSTADLPNVNVDFIYLKGDPELIMQRLHNRKNHFLGSNMLASQFDTLQEPDPSQENSNRSKTIIIPLSLASHQPRSLEEMVDEALQKLASRAGFPTDAIQIATKSSTHLPSIPALFDSEPSRLLEVLALLFEVSDSIENKLIPILREKIREGCLKSYSELIDRCEDIVENQFGYDDQVNFLGSHPRIGEVKGLSKLSSNEQGNQTDPRILARLEELNMMYEKVYTGLRYVTFVNGRSRGEIVEEMEALLFKQDATLTTEFHQQDHQWKAELKRGIADVFKIAHSRLSSITPAPNP
ncbi:hypothetical protein PCANC_12955 [Puccinia coronata f. sp. avenae]|uniref:gluconokinase n=1 Tax=Puccinia coronata f. sp. avenae TaxID=200324 RepID=A0A2N5SD44_9BASI|nr:hypothetical protein PCASD_19271 [Puccinia coronata f. sp. avenae]PLW14537.1 hypothetical protein PCANC_12955 [Puccinia coronata f. sp. avenae]